jgi:hypothetical protein
LRRDKYQALGGRERRALEALVSGWPRERAHASASEDTQALLETLLHQGLLTKDAASGKELELPRIAPPDAVLCDDDVCTEESIDWRDMVRFSIACSRAALALRVLRLDRVVDVLRRRKQRALARGEVSSLAHDRQCLNAFNRLRPFAFTADLSCLYDSLALLEFLALQGSYPDWVIGVHTSPFAAHSWLQAHGFLFNGPIDHVARYTPILVV